MMKLFVNDTPVEIISADEALDLTVYDNVIDARVTKLKDVKLKDDVLVRNATSSYIKDCLDYFSKQKVKKLDSISFAVKDKEATSDFIKSQFEVIKAAGGLVVRDDKVLLIYRLGKWDLPKGKIEKKEQPLQGAVREVEEECSVSVEARDKICHTWHTYNRNKKKILKKTYWYLMDCTDDSNMKPQTEEDIDDVRWMTFPEAKQALYNSYFSIRYVFREYQKKHDSLS